MRRRWTCLIMTLVLVSCATAGRSDSPRVPADAERLTGPAIRTFLAGNTFRFVVYDAAKALTGTSTWDSENGTVFGTFSWNLGPSKRWQRTWWVEGDRNCTRSEGKAPECQTIYAKGDQFWEVREDGQLHAMSTRVR